MINWLQFSFIAYFVVLLAVGVFFGRKQTSSVEFIVGNRSSNFWITALNAHASDMSVWVFMALPAAFFVEGMQKIWIVISLIVGMFLNWHYIAKRLRVQTENYDTCTLSTFFERRFKDRSHVLRTLTAFISVFFLAAYVSAGLIAMGYLFEYVFDVDYYVGLFVATAVVASYIYVGGFQAVARTDFFQGIFLLVVILIVPVVAYGHVSGWTGISAAAQAKGISLEIQPSLSAIFLSLSWGMGYFGQPHIITKFMGIKDPNEIIKSKYFGIAWQILVLGAGAMIGLTGIAFFQNVKIENPEMIFIEMSRDLFLPQFTGIIFCGVVAANMSTIASQILVCASALSEDLYKEIRKDKATQAQLLKISRFSAIAVSIIALVMAFAKSATIMEVVLYAWTGLGASFGPLVIMSLYSHSANRYGAIAGVCVGAFLAATWPALNPYIINYHLPAMIPAFTISLLVIYVVSLATRSCCAAPMANEVSKH